MHLQSFCLILAAWMLLSSEYGSLAFLSIGLLVAVWAIGFMVDWEMENQGE
jgi:multisubunit Na+/H+ antiporter MnhE subunit